MKFSEMTAAQLLEIRRIANEAAKRADTYGLRDYFDLIDTYKELISRGYQHRTVRGGKFILVPPPPEAPGL